MAKPKEVTLGQYSESQLLCVSVYFSVLVCVRVHVFVLSAHSKHFSLLFFIRCPYSREEIYGCLLPSNQVTFDKLISTLALLTAFILSFRHILSSLPQLHNSTGYQQSESVYRVCVRVVRYMKAGSIVLWHSVEHIPPPRPNSPLT